MEQRRFALFLNFKKGNSYHSNDLVISACYNVSVTHEVTEKRLMADVPLVSRANGTSSARNTLVHAVSLFFVPFILLFS